jgi:hypothetical protein
MSNPGTSINFDGQALQNLQEAEYRKEEEEQEHEVGQRSDYRKEEEREHKVGQKSGHRNLNTEMTAKLEHERGQRSRSGLSIQEGERGTGT